MGKAESSNGGSAVYALINRREEIVKQRLCDCVGLVLAGIARALLIVVLGVKRPGEQLGVVCLLTLEVLVEVEGMAAGVLVLHISGDDVQVVQIHRGIVFGGDLLLGFAAGVGILAGVGSRRAVGLAALGAIGSVVPSVCAVGQFGEEVVGEDLRKQVVRGRFHVAVLGDGLFRARDGLVVLDEVLVVVGELFGLAGFLGAVRVLGLVEIQRIRRFVEGRRLTGAGRVGGRYGAVRQLIVRGRVEAACEVFAGLGGAGFARGLIGNLATVLGCVVEQRLVALVGTCANALMLVSTLTGEHTVAILHICGGDGFEILHEFGLDGIRLKTVIRFGGFGHLHKQCVVFVAGQAA